MSSTSVAQADSTSQSLGRAQSGLASLHIEGPYAGSTTQETSSRRQIFTCYPTRVEEEAGCAEQILVPFARRAYRRPLAPQDVQSLLAVYDAGRTEGRTFELGIQFALEKTLVAPDFLFRVERGPESRSTDAVHPDQ